MTVLFANILVYFIKYIISFTLLFIIVPCFIFTNKKNNITKIIVINYVKVCFWIIIFSYITVFLKLFEFITIFTAIIICSFYKYYKQHIISGNVQTEIKDDVQILVINHVDNIERIGKKISVFMSQRIVKFNSIISNYFSNPWSTINFIILCVVFIYAGYIHFYDSFINISPATGESYVSIAWVKYIGLRVIFHDNVFPQGFYIILAMLQKFLQLDHLFIINFTGGLNTLLVAFGMYFFVSTLSGNKAAGIISVIVYGWLGSFFKTSIITQVVANPEQYALVFVLPTLYFFYEYINQSKREDFFVALFGASIIGLVQPVVLAYLFIGIFALCIANILRDIKSNFFKTFEAIIIALISAVISIIPLGIGYLIGKPLSSMITDILATADKFIEMPILRLADYVGIGALVIIFMHSIVTIRNKNKFIFKFWIFLFGALSFALYLFGGTFTQSQIVNDCAVALWTLLLPIVIAFAFFALFNFLEFIFGFGNLGYLICAVAIVTVLVLIPQNPIVIDRAGNNSSSLQYLRISKAYRPTQWMIVSKQEGYSLTLGNGYHMIIDYFLKTYNPEYKKLIDSSGLFPMELNTNDIFIFNEKNVPEDDKSEQLLINEWIEKFKKNHSNISLYYNDENLEVWQIHQEPDKEEIKNRVWQE